MHTPLVPRLPEPRPCHDKFFIEPGTGKVKIQAHFSDLRGCAVSEKKNRMLGCLVCRAVIGIRDRPMVGQSV